MPDKTPIDNFHNPSRNCFRRILLIALVAGLQLSVIQVAAQPAKNGKKISPHLFGLFFEDINYAADGGLYAEQVQNRSFEYSPTDRREWHPFSFWRYITPGYSYGSVDIVTDHPVHPNNPHYLKMHIEHVGDSGIGIQNSGFGGMVIKAGAQYNVSFFSRLMSKDPITLLVSLRDPRDKLLAEKKITVSSDEWKQNRLSLRPASGNDTAHLVILGTTPGTIALDMVSLFPEQTFRNRPNGLRADLAQMIADMKPGFVRFPGGCLVHGDGLGNMYRWKHTIGPLEERTAQKNIWGYHQTMGLGYYEYFQFCEDIGAKPVPVLPAAVSCQNSGGTWRIGGTGQQAIPMEDMDDYIQEVFDLVEWANGPATSEWGAKRAAAGHPEPFKLEYIGIGNEDKITPQFEQRFKMIYDAMKAKHPEITVIGTVGPFSSGEDYDKGWVLANQLNVPMVDEHYYNQPEWFISNQYRYDEYKRQQSHVYLGEYASWGNTLRHALAEAAYMTALERNGDVVEMASYAPMLARIDFTQWKTDMIFFDNSNIYPTVNYYVQKMFSANQGDRYYGQVIRKDNSDSALAGSCVVDSRTGDIIIKLVNAASQQKDFQVNLSGFKKIHSTALRTVLTGAADAANTSGNPAAVVPVQSDYMVSKKFTYAAPPRSLTVIRVKTKK